ncbi:hypothetical protein AVEN_157770-1 [Araneus ventricosus]|uniref:Uncharacterized protein n=1 Tax=Araneus ventricosus TaxID=182803 RepID=A0A4Y2F0N7_ARAVE|nr:hypothetical protein AVEN_157770-1 [Araneus ventricosus]
MKSKPNTFCTDNLFPNERTSYATGIISYNDRKTFLFDFHHSSNFIRKCGRAKVTGDEGGRRENFLLSSHQPVRQIQKVEGEELGTGERFITCTFVE